MKRSIIFLLAEVLTLFACAQVSITGRVSDASDHEPLPGAVVRIYSDGKMKSFGTAKSDGSFKINVPNLATDSVTVSVQCIGYSKEERKIPYLTTSIDFLLKADNVTLREVKVEAPKIRVLGDTITYNLASYLGKSDVTLEDGLKKLPGIDVDKSGKINYQGKGISKFYIEGMDMLGGKYNLATQNLPATYVTDVEVINNHNEAKIDRGRQSDNVALNVKLRSKVKFKPVGTTEATGGYGDGWLYQLGGTGMMFTPTFQTMLSAKIGNIKEFARGYDTDLIVMSSENSSSLAERAAGKLGGSTPPVSKGRYISPRDRSVSLNFMKKLTEDRSVKVNTSYTYSATDYSYIQQSSYYAGDKEIVFGEINRPSESEHRPSIDIRYTENSENSYTSNRFNAKAGFASVDFMTISDDRNLTQRSDIKDVSIQNSFSRRIKAGSRIWNIWSTVSFNRAPEAELYVSDYLVDSRPATQRLSSHTFKARIEGATTFKFRLSSLHLPIKVDYDNEHVRSSLSGTSYFNNVIGNQATFSTSPSYEYTSFDRRVELRGTVTLQMKLYRANNRSTASETNHNAPYVEPNIRVKYILNPDFNVSLFSSLSHSVGDLLDMLTAPIMTSYRSQKVASGILAKGQSFNSSLRFDFKKPMEFWFANASVSYNEGKHNILNSQYVTDSDITTSGLNYDSHSRSLSTQASIAKHFNSFGGKFSLSGGYVWNKNEMMQQDMIIPYYGQSYNIGGKITLSPWSFMELNYEGRYSKTFSRYLGIRESYDMLNNEVKLSVYPAAGWDIFGGMEFISKELTDNSHKSISLFDAGVRYKHKKFRYILRADNILNTKTYYYSVYSGLDRYNYSYRLRPRTVTFGITFTM